MTLPRPLPPVLPRPRPVGVPEDLDFEAVGFHTPFGFEPLPLDFEPLPFPFVGYW